MLAAEGVSRVAKFAAAMLPQTHFASRLPLLHLALKTGTSLIAFLADSAPRRTECTRSDTESDDGIGPIGERCDAPMC